MFGGQPVTGRKAEVWAENGPVAKYSNHYTSAGLEPGDSSLRRPEVEAGITEDSTGKLWFSDLRDKHIRSLPGSNPTQDTISNPSQLTGPDGIKKTKNGDVWVADRIRNVIRRYGPTGSLKRSFGSTGSEAGQFQGAYALATSNWGQPSEGMFPIGSCPARVYVCDKGNHRIQIFDTLGNLQIAFGESILSQPVAIALDTNNCCFVTDPAKRSMTIRYALPRPGHVRLNIYDITGKRVKTLVNNRPTKPGYYNLTWNCTDQRDRRLAAGVYFCRLVVTDEPRQTWGNAEALRSITRTRKLVVAR